MEQQAEKYLLALLREDTNKILTLIERIASEQKSKEVFCKEILKIAAEKKFTQWIIDYSDNWQTIKKYCEGNIKKENWLSKNDYANTKWLITTAIAVTAIFLKLK